MFTNDMNDYTYTLQEQEQLDQILEDLLLYDEASFNLLAEDIQYDIFSEAITGGSVKRAVQKTSGKVRRADKKVSRAIDGTADAALDGGRKQEIKSIREDLLRGRAKPSTIIKRAVKCALGAAVVASGAGAAAITPALALLGFIASTLRRRHISHQEYNQIIWEYEQELKIVDEKISDAASEGDKKKKYQYMRIKGELERNLNQLKYQGKIQQRPDAKKREMTKVR